MELHENDNDFLMVFEHHEDIVVLNAEKNATGGSFFQVKTKGSGTWTVNNLVSAGKKPSSILEKLYDNYQKFPKGSIQLCFVSNAKLSSTHKIDGKNKKEFLDYATFFYLSTEEKEKVWDNLKLSESVCAYDDLEKFVFIRTAMTPDTHDDYTKGRFTTFLNNLYPNQPICATEAYRSMFEDIRLKTNVERASIDAQEFRTKKCISKSEFDMFTQRVGVTKNLDVYWSATSIGLTNEGYSPMERKKFGNGFKQYGVDLLSLSDARIDKLQRMINERLNWYMEHSINSPMREMLDETAEYLRENFEYVDDYENAEEYFKCAILYNLSVI